MPTIFDNMFDALPEENITFVTYPQRRPKPLWGPKQNSIWGTPPQIDFWNLSFIEFVNIDINDRSISQRRKKEKQLFLIFFVKFHLMRSWGPSDDHGALSRRLVRLCVGPALHIRTILTVVTDCCPLLQNNMSAVFGYNAAAHIQSDSFVCSQSEF